MLPVFYDLAIGWYDGGADLWQGEDRVLGSIEVNQWKTTPG